MLRLCPELNLQRDRREQSVSCSDGVALSHARRRGGDLKSFRAVDEQGALRTAKSWGDPSLVPCFGPDFESRTTA